LPGRCYPGGKQLNEPSGGFSDYQMTDTEGDVAPEPTSEDRARQDEWLVVRCQLGERPAFDALIDRWHAPLWRYIRQLTSNDDVAHEIAQEVWLRVIRGIGRLRDGAKFRAWLFGIARRVLMDRLRAQYAAPMAAETEIADVPADDDTGVDPEVLSAALHDELAKLPLIEREVLTLFYLRELSLGEVADVLGVPLGTVKSRLFRARHLLRRELEARGDLV
jgi:RNA polymerase sigma factor (sigma-70 family)